MILTRSVWVVGSAIAAALVAVVASAGEEKGASSGAMGSAHMPMTPKDLKWGDAPPSFPKGAKLAVIQGDPSAAGEVVAVRLKMPKGYALPPHFHPTDEAVTVLSGSFSVGMGDKIDKASAKALGPGGYVVVPKEAHHWGFATVPTEVQVHMIGPFAITYVNAADDPQAKAGQ